MSIFPSTDIVAQHFITLTGFLKYLLSYIMMENTHTQTPYIMLSALMFLSTHLRQDPLLQK